MNTPTLQISIRLDHVVDEGGVEPAIEAVVRRQFEGAPAGRIYRSGRIPSYRAEPLMDGSCLINEDAGTVDDWAARALMDERGVAGYIDSTTGALATKAKLDPDPAEPCVVACTLGWTEESVVKLECPTLLEALNHPDEFLEMLEAGRDHHDALLDKDAWITLIYQVQEFTKRIERIHSAEFELLPEENRIALARLTSQS